MLYPKNGPKPLEAEDGEKIHGPPTPHRIKLSSEPEEIRSKQVIPEKRKKAAAITFSPVQNADQKTQRTVIKRRRKQNSNNTPATKTPAETNHKLTEYYTVRRSVRKCKTTVLEEKQRNLENKIISGCEDGLEVREK